MTPASVDDQGQAIHAEVLVAAQRLSRSSDWTFRLVDVVRALPHRNERTVRTHVASRCCVNAPANHPHRWPYFRRLQRGIYRIEPAFQAAGEPLREWVLAPPSAQHDLLLPPCHTKYLSA